MAILYSLMREWQEEDDECQPYLNTCWTSVCACCSTSCAAGVHSSRYHQWGHDSDHPAHCSPCGIGSAQRCTHCSCCDNLSGLLHRPKVHRGVSILSPSAASPHRPLPLPPSGTREVSSTNWGMNKLPWPPYARATRRWWSQEFLLTWLQSLGGVRDMCWSVISWHQIIWVESHDVTWCGFRQMMSYCVLTEWCHMTKVTLLHILSHSVSWCHNSIVYIANPFPTADVPPSAIPVEEFPTHVKHLHSNDDYHFSEEYKVWLWGRAEVLSENMYVCTA